MANDNDAEVDWHRKRIAENRILLDELDAGNKAGGEVFPETQAEIERLQAQIEQSELIVVAQEKQISDRRRAWPPKASTHSGSSSAVEGSDCNETKSPPP
jgi:hypothetical protein